MVGDQRLHDYRDAPSFAPKSCRRIFPGGMAAAGVFFTSNAG